MPESTNLQTLPKTMKLILPIACVAFAATSLFGQVTETTTTTTTTSNGMLTEYVPGTTFVIKESTGPVKYTYGKTVTYVTKKGIVLKEDEVRTRLKLGIPVSVEYVRTGEDRMISRVVIDD